MGEVVAEATLDPGAQLSICPTDGMQGKTSQAVLMLLGPLKIKASLSKPCQRRTKKGRKASQEGSGQLCQNSLTWRVESRTLKPLASSSAMPTPPPSKQQAIQLHSPLSTALLCSRPNEDREALNPARQSGRTKATQL